MSKVFIRQLMAILFTKDSKQRTFESWCMVEDVAINEEDTRMRKPPSSAPIGHELLDLMCSPLAPSAWVERTLICPKSPCRASELQAWEGGR